MNRNLITIGCLAATLGLQAQTQRPTNFIIINCDDLGYGDLGAFGHPTIHTPHLDRMAFEGQRWTSFYVTSSVSSPSRASLLTGRLPVRSGMYGNERLVLFPDSPQGLPESEITIATLLRNNGYTTACVGKWHLGHLPESMPLQHGFDYFYGIPFSNDMSKKEQRLLFSNYDYEFELPFHNQNETIEFEPDQTQLTKRLTEYSISFIEKNRDNPFFLYLAHPMPHIPLYASEDFFGKSKRGLYGDAVEELDWSIGQIMNVLRENGIENNTIIIFTSDNGAWLNFGLDGGTSGLLKDGKGSTYEGGFRVPTIIWGGGVVPATVSSMGSTLDIFPTLSEIAKIELPQDRAIDGISLTNVLFQNEESLREYFPFFIGNRLHAFRRNNYKIHLLSGASSYGVRVPETSLPLLYDVEQDPSERFDISTQQPELIEELMREAEKFLLGLEIKESLFDLPAVRK
jgi:arylsulfatase